MKKPEQTILIFALFCIILNIYSIFALKNLFYGYLTWNLFLAYIPYFFANQFVASVDKKQPAWIQILLFFLWLAFFPNTIYMVTDFIHLYEQRTLPVLFDVAEIFSYAWTAVFLAFLSLHKVEQAITKKFNANKSLVVIIFTIFLSSIGVYIGRFLRWNSWDLIVRPWSVVIDFFQTIAQTGGFLNFIGMIVVFSGMFAGVYFSLRALTQKKEEVL